MPHRSVDAAHGVFSVSMLAKRGFSSAQRPRRLVSIAILSQNELSQAVVSVFAVLKSLSPKRVRVIRIPEEQILRWFTQAHETRKSCAAVFAPWLAGHACRKVHP